MDVNLPFRVQMLLNQAKGRIAFLVGPPFDRDHLQPVISVLEEALGHLRQAMGDPLRDSEASGKSQGADNSKRGKSKPDESRPGQ